MNLIAKNSKLVGKIALVTGASRGIGKGIAEALMSSGATVYITGRKHTEGSNLQTVHDTAEELNKLNMGKCHGVFCDHLMDNEVNTLFQNIVAKERKLDILVNNSFSGADCLPDLMNENFWETNPSLLWNKIMDGGLRSNYISSCIASKIMVGQKCGLIVNISSAGSLIPLFGTLYCVGKEGTDRMTVNMGLALKKHNVAVVSLWPGVVRTELNARAYASGDKQLKNLWPISEGPTLTGLAIAELSIDSSLLKKTARIHYVADLAHHYGLKDLDGATPTSFRSVRFAVYYISPTLSKAIPHFIKVPGFLMSALFSKF